MPPVGINFMPVWPKGPPNIFNALAPPEVSAGKNFRCFQPSSNAAMTSVEVTTPGNSIKFLSCAALETVSLRPGETPNCAPESTAALTLSTESKVPAPTIIWGISLRMRAMDSAAPAVRKVTSIQLSPPDKRARASGTASSGLSMTATQMRRCLRRESMFINFYRGYPNKSRVA